MSYDKRYYGIYQGFVKDTDDPEEGGRVRLTVPQVTGEVEWTGWAPNAGGGSISQTNLPYGTFFTTSSQTVTAANTATIVTNWQEEDTNKMNVSGTKIYAEETGDYLIVWSAMLNKSNAASSEADIWLKVNGTNVANSNTRGHLSGSDAETVLTASAILDLEAGDYFEVAFSSPSDQVKLQYYSASTSPTRPAVPGIIITANLVGKYKPKADQKVWVMYIGGDPNFPVWMGAQA